MSSYRERIGAIPGGRAKGVKVRKSARILRAKQEAREAEKEAARKKRIDGILDRSRKQREAIGRRHLKLLKHKAEQEFVGAGGDPDDFEDEWPGLRDDLIRSNVTANLRAHFDAGKPRPMTGPRKGM